MKEIYGIGKYRRAGEHGRIEEYPRVKGHRKIRK